MKANGFRFEKSHSLGLDTYRRYFSTDMTWKNTDRKQRLQSMDLLKFLAIFLVLWGHSEQYLLSCDYSERAVYRHIYSFHMPLFMMISGFFYAMTIKSGIISNILHKARHLLLPVLGWSGIMFLAMSVLHRHFPPLESYLDFAVYGLWFLKSVFACSILGIFPFLIFRNHFALASVIASVVSQVLFFIPVVNLPFMFPAFLVGGIVYMYHDFFTSNLRWIVPLCGLIWVVCNMFLDADAYQMMNAGEKTYSISYIFERFCWKIYKYAMGLSGALFFMGLFEVIFSSPRSSRVMSICTEWGGMTLGIYILQSFILEDYLANRLNFDDLPSLIFDFVISPLISLGVMVTSVIIIRLIRFNAYLSYFLLGIKEHKIQNDRGLIINQK